ncbi:bifunctional 3-(3-hydroxy-phenyl)propionate/3-hydroxycinnamic acid hydroxylase [Arthrobacter sp. zg-Y859]|uniref:Bifunctional 3-(3-hydroxy-phenyl)propionate/3-hydroxycinnamic acid hydroxylase n=1 Tax=Arthrobacter jinronghuae TaxID=2964609 RepID=A0ABT1NMJ6_9MICC|nr:bifunctional 3-(3-hydroxy-phenyl)propionate/3-hydroxycinnamic acid hydroxylase [Arthrobacter jinronghuae]MCQ1948931.1 bifunctional 3-(3-hydroxy-phenyl)propionate/3-hydroxycinnamic acid hydroxylase [Arthrobacter jinronghuae]UWX78265.1 bifunctional 3-(3-hydroxy-phenyl)propionate/3-hydroxycinnamic acid hydroxylase [Arthrobacter jinronghuae]
MSDNDVDVLVVGQGVVGQLTSLYLAQRGYRVLAVEQHREPYSLPRAVHYDPDVNRFLAGVGLDAEEQATFSEPALSYDWLTADRKLLLTFPAPLDGPQGWPESTMFAQPDLEAALRRHQEMAEGLEIRWGTALTGFDQDAEGVSAFIHGPAGGATVRAKFLVGCDGANSAVRELAGLAMTDLDFSSDWLVMDLQMAEREWTPENGQICDPLRPTSVVSGGPGRRRFEFMLMPGEDAAAFASTENAWELVAPWEVTPEKADLERLAMYTFNARCVTEWSRGRVFVAGDAAHQMPPFFGRGMVSGVRDVANLVWKIDHVLSGLAPLSLLDTYGSERGAHVQHALMMSLELGRMICETDPAKVEARDTHFLSAGPFPWNALPPMPPEILGPGFFPGGAPGSDPVAGRIGVQGRLRGLDGSETAADRITWGEFVAFVDGRVVSEDDAERIRAAKPAGFPCKVIEVMPADTAARNRHSGSDVDGRYGEVFDTAVAVVYRPDFHGFASAKTVDDAVNLMAALEPTHLRESA